VALFPRYLFVSFDPAHDDWAPIRHTRGVAALISHTISQPSSLRPGIIEHFIARTSSRGVVDDPGDNRPPLPVGASVNVISGALAGLSGIVRMSGAERCEVLLTLFAANVPVQVRTDDLCISV
jgi:transcriptional antiterminator RfaH